MRAGQVHRIAQEMHKQSAILDLCLNRRAIYRDRQRRHESSAFDFDITSSRTF
jgi:hypothetical protein